MRFDIYKIDGLRRDEVQMSQADIQDFFTKISTDEHIKKQLLNALGALSKEDQEFKDQLLNTLDTETDRTRKKKKLRSLFSNLKMEVVFQIILTAILIAVFVVFVYLTYIQINTRPEGILMSDGHMEMYDPFSRAKDLLILIIPVFTTVISFWLGYSVQERKVIEAKTSAEEHRLMLEKADQMMAKIEGRMMTTLENDDINNLSSDIHKIMED
jgi:hypothetical protein